MMKGTIFEIKRFAVHDGSGIRTTVFLKGCSLKCIWCHNPEGIAFQPQLAYLQDKCIHCGECISVCRTGAQKAFENQHIFDRSLCVSCGKCETVCLGTALTLYGRSMSVEDLLPELLKDRDFYDNSNGGITLSGGECLMQAEFCAELLRNIKENNINTAVDTCGFVPREAIKKVMPYTDTFLYDIKAYEDHVHIKCTGQSNKIILENLEYIISCGKDVEVRIPFVPGYNTDQIDKIGAYLSSLNHITAVKVLPYHNYAGSKYASLEMSNTLPKTVPKEWEIKNAKELLSAHGLRVQ